MAKGPEYQTEPTAGAPQQEAPMDLAKRRVARGRPDLNEGMTAEQGFNMAQESMRPGQGSLKGPDLEATEDEQAEYERAMAALSKVLYEDERTSNAVVRQLTPEEKVGSIAKASMLVISQLDQRLDFDEVIIPQFTQDVTDRIVDLYENVHGEVSEQEAQRAFGATWEGVMEMYGVDENDYAELTAGMSDEEFQGYKQQYKSFLGED